MKKTISAKFKVGDKVSLDVKKLFNIPTRVVKATIDARHGLSPHYQDQNVYQVNIVLEGAPCSLTMLIREEFLSSATPQIAGHEVIVLSDGLQVGCTRISDEDIRLAAKLRNII